MSKQCEMVIFALRKIKGDLVAAGISQTRIAKDLGVHPSMVSKVLSGTKTSERVLRRILDVLDQKAA